ncbi:MAG: hypothetical protein ACHQHO_04345 [Solirubrobacterales bacterium]
MKRLMATCLALVLIVGLAGCGGSSSTQTQKVVNALSAALHDKYTSVEDGTCSLLGNGDECEFKIEGEWHDDIWAEPHPDGTISWEDTSSGRGSVSGEISAAEAKQ